MQCFSGKPRVFVLMLVWMGQAAALLQPSTASWQQHSDTVAFSAQQKATVEHPES